MSKLESLEQLAIENCAKLKELIAEEIGDQSCYEGKRAVAKLPHLKQLVLTSLPQLNSLCKGKLVCASLRSLAVKDCPNLKCLPFSCMTKNQELVHESRSLLGQDDEASPKKKRKAAEPSIWSIQTYTQLVNFQRLIKILSAYEKEAGMLLNDILSDGRGPGRGNLIPVRKLFGKVASVALYQLQALLQDNEVGRIAIQGIKGIGKTLLMKHLHNSVLKWDKRFDYVLWVTCPDQFSIKCLQDAVAAALKCELRRDDTVIRRAEILSGIFAGLGSFVIFLDDVPEAQFSLDLIGIPEGSEGKLVLTSRSTLVPEMLNCYRTAIDRLCDEEAFQLFMNEARISRSAALPESIPWLLAKNCHGVPHKIMEMATHMRGIEDPDEWNHALFEFTAG